MKRNIVITTAAFILIALLQGVGFAVTGKEIIRRSDNQLRGDSQMARVEIVIKSRRFKRTLKMEFYHRSDERKSLAIINAPRKDAGNRFLLIKDNIWHYQPDIQKVIKISPSMMLDSWMGSDFTNDDIVNESNIVNEYKHELLGSEEVNGYSCYKVKLTPKEETAIVWGKILYYARKKDCLPVKEEFYNQHGKLKKVMTCSDFQKMDDRVIPVRYKMRTIGDEDQYTLMIYKKINFNVSIPDKIFTMQYLKKG